DRLEHVDGRAREPFASEECELASIGADINDRADPREERQAVELRRRQHTLRQEWPPVIRMPEQGSKLEHPELGKRHSARPRQPFKRRHEDLPEATPSAHDTNRWIACVRSKA